MRFTLLVLLALLPTVLHAASKPDQRYTTATIKVKETNPIGQFQQVDKTILLNTVTGEAWLFVGGRDESKVRLVPIGFEVVKTFRKGKENGRN